MSEPCSLLLIEDDNTIALGVVRFMEKQGYRIKHVTTGEDGLRSVDASPPDLVILDWLLPGMDGIAVLRALKEQRPDLPVIILTAPTGEGERVQALDRGADDYMPKPFSLMELEARVRVRLKDRHRGAPQTGDSLLCFGNVKVDLRHRILHKDGVETRLTTHEAGVLEYLAARPGVDVPREDLLKNVWGYVPTINTRTVDNQILKLRKKLEENPNDPHYILTIYGTGYRFEP